MPLLVGLQHAVAAAAAGVEGLGEGSGICECLLLMPCPSRRAALRALNSRCARLKARVAALLREARASSCSCVSCRLS
jgi:hypothetical protein